jgi:diguanylate cyclase (GGDEF)-like protein
MLSNRRGFEALAQHALNVCKRLEKPASVLFFDLNGFKAINDTYGHAEGDRALATFAELLRTSLRDSDVIGRLGGDEFVALLTDSTVAGTAEILRRLQQCLNRLNGKLQRGYDIRYSVGQVEFDVQRHVSISTLLAQADAAMYAHKQASKALPA